MQKLAISELNFVKILNNIIQSQGFTSKVVLHFAISESNAIFCAFSLVYFSLQYPPPQKYEINTPRNVLISSRRSLISGVAWTALLATQSRKNLGMDIQANQTYKLCVGCQLSSHS